jgi:hypothetical protein
MPAKNTVILHNTKSQFKCVTSLLQRPQFLSICLLVQPFNLSACLAAISSTIDDLLICLFIHSFSYIHKNLFSPSFCCCCFSGHSTTCCSSSRCRCRRRWRRTPPRCRQQHFAILHGRFARFPSHAHQCLGGFLELCGCRSHAAYSWKVPFVI